VRDPYEVLGLERNASEAEIKSAFRRLAALHHPDKNPEDPGAATRFKECNLAHQILSDPQKRAAFDRYGEAAFRPGAVPGVDFSDFAGIDEIFGDLLGAFGIRTGDRGDLRKTLTLTFEEAALGCERTLSYERLDTCEGCGGKAAAVACVSSKRSCRSRSSARARAAAARGRSPCNRAGAAAVAASRSWSARSRSRSLRARNTAPHAWSIKRGIGRGRKSPRATWSS
jgi:molecular chaperone DnaJ